MSLSSRVALHADGTITWWSSIAPDWSESQYERNSVCGRLQELSNVEHVYTDEYDTYMAVRRDGSAVRFGINVTSGSVSWDDCISISSSDP